DPPPRRARRHVMEEKAHPVGHSREARAIGYASVDEDAAANPDRMEEKRHGARRVDSRGDVAGREHARAVAEHVVHGHGGRHARGGERLLYEERVELLAKEAAAQEPEPW